MEPRKPMLERVRDGRTDELVLPAWQDKYKRYNFKTSSPEQETLRTVVSGNGYFDAGTLPEIEVRPPNDNAVFKANYMIPNRELRNQFYNTIDEDSYFSKDSRTYVNRLYDLYLKSNKPTIKSTAQRFSPDMQFMQKIGFMRGDETRASYNPVFNTMYVDPEHAASDILAEMAHAYQIHGTDTPRDFNWMKQFLSRPNGDMIINGKDGYHTPGSLEYVAHSIIEPRLRMYVNSDRYPYDYIRNGIQKAYNRSIRKPKRGPYINTKIQ